MPERPKRADPRANIEALSKGGPDPRQSKDYLSHGLMLTSLAATLARLAFLQTVGFV